MKTKVMKISKRPGEEFTIFLEGKQLTTLGALLDRRILEKEIRPRTAWAKNAFTKRKELPTKAFSLYLKKWITIYVSLEYSSVWSRIVDPKERLERGRAKAGEL